MFTKKTALATAATLLLASPLLTACGSDEDEAKSAAEEVLHAMGSYDGEKYCDRALTEDNSKPLKDDSAKYDECKKAISSLKELDKEGKLKGLASAKVKKANVDGDKAVINVTDIEGLDEETKKEMAPGEDPNSKGLHLKKVDDKWYVENQKSETTATQPTNKP